MKAQCRPVSIYLILDESESPRYVGQTLRPGIRPLDHLRKHPEWAKSYRVLEIVPFGVRWQDRERYWIAYYRRFAVLENIASGGGCSGPKSPDAVRRQREKMLGRKLSPETLAKIRRTVRSRTPEEQAKVGRRISEGKKGKIPNWSPEGKARTIESLKRRGSPMKGKKHSPETIALLRIKNIRPANRTSFKKGDPPRERTAIWRERISLANSGRVVSEETKVKIREKRKLQVMAPRSAETKAKISAAHKGKSHNWSSPERKNFLGQWVREHGSNRAGCVNSEESKRRVSETKRKSELTLRGERHPQAKLNATQVLAIRAKYQPNVYTKRMLAREYDISIPNVKSILSRRLWAHI